MVGSDVEDVPSGLGEASGGLWANEGALIELLGLVATAEIGVECAARAGRAVAGAAVPDVGIEDDDSSGGGEQQDFVRVWSRRVSQSQARDLAAAMRARDNACCAILWDEVIEQPDRVADGVVVHLHRLAPIGVQRLESFARSGHATIQRRELELA